MTDKRVVRGEVRRSAWERVAKLLARAAGIPKGTPPEYHNLFRATLAEIEEYANKRARGEPCSPPGGVGSGR